MKKFVLFSLILTLSFSTLAAGDVASFVDLGFTEDGKYYFFGQYGKTDKNFQGYAEIYQVDIAENDYVDGGVFKIAPSAVTANKNGQEVYEALEAKSYYYLKNYKYEKANIDHVLYILDDVNKTGTDEIVFTDFRGSNIETPDSYHIRLVPTISGLGKNVKSSFYITLVKKDYEGNTISEKKVGTPSIARKGVSNYKIERIFCDNEERNLIFIIEKMVQDDTGVSIRYMIEAAKF